MNWTPNSAAMRLMHSLFHSSHGRSNIFTQMGILEGCSLVGFIILCQFFSTRYLREKNQGPSSRMDCLACSSRNWKIMNPEASILRDTRRSFQAFLAVASSKGKGIRPSKKYPTRYLSHDSTSVSSSSISTSAIFPLWSSGK